LVLFGDDQVAKTEANNPADVYSIIINETKTKNINLQNILDNSLNSRATGKGGTIDKNDARKNCELFVSNGEGLIKYRFGEGSSIYVEFYPSGVTGFLRASEPEFKTMMNVFATKANDYKIKLGNDFAIEATAKNKAYINSFSDHVVDNSNISTTRSDQEIAHDELAMQLTKNVLTIALQNLGNVAAVSKYFNTSLLFGAHHQHVFNITLLSNEVQTPIEKQFVANAEFTIKATQTVEIGLSNVKNEMQKNSIIINPNQQTTIKVADFNVDLATYHFVVIKNTSSDIADVKIEI
jgi:hypothetical protein